MARGPAPSAPRPAPARCRTGPVAVRGKPANRVHGLRFLDTKGGTHTAFPGRWGPSRRASLMLCTPLAALLSQALSLGASERRPHSGERHPLFNKLASGSPLGLCVEFSLSSLARSLPKDPRSSPRSCPAPPPTWGSRPSPSQVPARPCLARVTRVSPGLPSPGPCSLLRMPVSPLLRLLPSRVPGLGEQRPGVPGRKGRPRTRAGLLSLPSTHHPGAGGPVRRLSAGGEAQLVNGEGERGQKVTTRQTSR